MAYSNWGAFVYEDKKRRRDKEDTGVFDTDESEYQSGVRIYANILKNREKFPEGAVPWYTHSHHAVLGDNEVRLCGYKNWPELWVWRNEEPERIELKSDEVPIAYDEVTVNGKTWRYSYEMSDNMVHLGLEEPDGTKWAAMCGFEYGAGHME